MAVFCRVVRKMWTDDPPHWKIWGHWLLFWGQFYFISIIDFKFVGTWAPTNKIIGEIRDFPMLNVPIFQPWRNIAMGPNRKPTWNQHSHTKHYGASLSILATNMTNMLCKVYRSWWLSKRRHAAHLTRIHEEMPLAFIKHCSPMQWNKTVIWNGIYPTAQAWISNHIQ